ncbi:hypothetical protein [Leptospira yasudae]|uniref:Uncharacterized protein n=1 Tax=Leptospira yasudae TaxID=2202201 RepID=A0A6N4QTG2_9LEPT|nr:hypothetical protein [Leptospira yasudae]TGL75164.1 hypothetical protein EHQ72_16830 [Leptospira yasudae]TGL77859.1 hypothetical protein EHQ77_14775 [Leptospira yasudae]TGL81266.1 hypothetical protein EHQ83_15550 [Leptospira yasudae]
MAQVRGKFITLVGGLMGVYKEARDQANQILFQATGKNYNELEPEGWYECEYYIHFMNEYVKASVSKQKALVTLGRQVYPTIKRTVGIPPEVKTPLDCILFEAEGFLFSHQGSGVVPRKFVKKEEGHVIVQAPSVGYPEIFMQGVFEGILEMYESKNGTVTITQGEPICEYEIKW